MKKEPGNDVLNRPITDLAVFFGGVHQVVNVTNKPKSGSGV